MSKERGWRLGREGECLTDLGSGKKRCNCIKRNWDKE